MSSPALQEDSRQTGSQKGGVLIYRWALTESAYLALLSEGWTCVAWHPWWHSALFRKDA